MMVQGLVAQAPPDPGVFLFVVFGFGVYFLPAMIALVRSHHEFVTILLINIFLGWTIIGWIAILAWALSSPQPHSGAK